MSLFESRNADHEIIDAEFGDEGGVEGKVAVFSPEDIDTSEVADDKLTIAMAYGDETTVAVVDRDAFEEALESV